MMLKDVEKFSVRSPPESYLPVPGARGQQPSIRAECTASAGTQEGL